MSKLLTQNELNKIRNSVFDYHPYAELLFDHIDILTTELKSSESRLHEVEVACANAEAELAQRDALSKPEPCYWEIAGQLFSTKEEALKPGYIGTPEPLWDDSVFDYLSQRNEMACGPVGYAIYGIKKGKVALHEVCEYRDNDCLNDDGDLGEYWAGNKLLYAAPPAPALSDALIEDEDGLPAGFADWYNQKFFGQNVDNARLSHCEEAWRAVMLAKKSVQQVTLSEAIEKIRNSGIDIDAEKILAEREDAAPQAGSAAIRDVIAERQRQITAEGWTPEHDDNLSHNELSDAAATYAFHARHGSETHVPGMWPWEKSWWKPTNPRRNLIKAGALILAEIERLDRANTNKEQK